MPLQLLDLLAQRRLRHPQPLRGLPEMQRLRDRRKVPQVPEFDFAIHIQNILIQIIRILDISPPRGLSLPS
jgi:hypothetical protein